MPRTEKFLSVKDTFSAIKSNSLHCYRYANDAYGALANIYSLTSQRLCLSRTEPMTEICLRNSKIIRSVSVTLRHTFECR